MRCVFCAGSASTTSPRIFPRAPKKAVGLPERWEQATRSLESALKAENIAYQVDEGGGAFYGPKIDLKIKDALGRPWQLGTIQFDFNLPERFNLTYIGEDGKGTPALHGAPRPVRAVWSVSSASSSSTMPEPFPCGWRRSRSGCCRSPQARSSTPGALAKLREMDVRVGVDADNEKLGAKIRKAQLERSLTCWWSAWDATPKFAVVSVRSAKEAGDQGAMKLEAFLDVFKEALKA